MDRADREEAYSDTRGRVMDLGLLQLPVRCFQTCMEIEDCPYTLVAAAVDLRGQYTRGKIVINDRFSGQKVY